MDHKIKDTWNRSRAEKSKHMGRGSSVTALVVQCYSDGSGCGRIVLNGVWLCQRQLVPHRPRGANLNLGPIRKS